MSVSDDHENPLDDVFSLISEKIESSIEEHHQQEEKDNKHLNSFVDALGSAIKTANDLKDDDLYQIHEWYQPPRDLRYKVFDIIPRTLLDNS